MTKFWMVLRVSNGNVPTKRHPTLESAQAEALRLAETHLQEFLILECVGAAKPVGKAELVQAEEPEPFDYDAMNPPPNPTPDPPLRHPWVLGDDLRTKRTSDTPWHSPPLPHHPKLDNV